MIRDASARDLPELYAVINDAASAYKDIIAADHWVEPYMSEVELTGQIEDGVRFRCWVEGDGIGAGQVTGVVGIQDKGEVNLIRHAYVRSAQRGRGVGGLLLTDLTAQTHLDRDLASGGTSGDVGRPALSAARLRLGVGRTGAYVAAQMLEHPRSASGNVGGAGQSRL